MADVKITKKDIQEAKRPDLVLVRASSLFDWLLDHRLGVLGVLALVLIAVSAVGLVRSAATAREREAGETLSAAVELSQRPVAAQSSGDVAAKLFASRQAKDEAVEAALAAVADKHPDTNAAAVARLDLARIQLSKGQYDEAIAGYQGYLDAFPKSGLRLLALEGLGYAFEGKSDHAKAGETFALLAGDGAPARALYHQARLNEAQGKKDEARKLYEQVVSEFEREQVSGEARVRLELLDVPAAGQGAFLADAFPTVPVAGKKPGGK